ncbi:MAG: NADH-quinone oxidoreductase subunit NuoH [Candidatus Thermoplasmatota archaeon]|nr:NADH-quinone oxidoreductase subunit NuoH [Candidatus Thermoplasmatota archaeon]MCL5731741.1 NADH-quinone oxidoreductase subunit NuoH [Candidatus Thermoplasmatota archaeon]
MSLLSFTYGIFKVLGYDLATFVTFLIDSIVFLLVASVAVAGTIYFFRKYMARVQLRIGPNRVGKFGTLQLIADAFKLFGKESILPRLRDDLPYKVAPVLVFIGLLVAFSILPYGSLYYIGDIFISNSGVGIILLFAVLAIMPIGELLAGISSHNKYSLIGALRAVAKDISFEVPMMLSVLAIVVMASARTTNSLNISSVVTSELLPYGILEPLGLFVFFISMIARASYTPFDMGESESELVSGYSTEYTGMRFGLFYLGMFGTILLGSFIVSLFYLGGYNGPYSSDIGLIYLLIKAVIVVVISFTVWLAMPRIRIDKFVNFGWKYLLPISVINLVLAGFLTIYLGW